MVTVPERLSCTRKPWPVPEEIHINISFAHDAKLPMAMVVPNFDVGPSCSYSRGGPVTSCNSDFLTNVSMPTC